MIISRGFKIWFQPENCLEIAGWILEVQGWSAILSQTQRRALKLKKNLFWRNDESEGEIDMVNENSWGKLLKIVDFHWGMSRILLKTGLWGTFRFFGQLKTRICNLSEKSAKKMKNKISKIYLNYAWCPKTFGSENCCTRICLKTLEYLVCLKSYKSTWLFCLFCGLSPRVWNCPLA